ncbi:hypothetical protein ACMFMF_007951 [Clarireedia jacksonii]
MPSLLSIIWKNKFNLPPLPPPGSFTGKTILITGASGGLGLAAAVHFVKLGAKSVIITARTAAKGEQAKASIESQAGDKSKDVVQVMELDMSTFAGTKAFADRVTREVKEIDVVCLNAGAISAQYTVGEEGWEIMIEIYLATTLLALLLLPWMKEAGKGDAHLGIVTSMYPLCRLVTRMAQFHCQEESIKSPSSTASQLYNTISQARWLNEALQPIPHA